MGLPVVTRFGSIETEAKLAPESRIKAGLENFAAILIAICLPAMSMVDATIFSFFELVNSIFLDVSFII